MSPQVLDRIAIRDLIDSWAVWRDAGDWERFATVWHDDGVMMATWFQGPAKDFIRVTQEGWAKGVSMLAGMLMIVFNDVEPASSAAPSTKRGSKSARAGSAERDLVDLREALRVARQEAQSAEEQSRASNEELQSTNEELTTSKEELQSMNEELQTVNQELQAKVDELSQASDDMRNLLNSTEIATVFLDELLHIRRDTSQALSVFKLIPSDVGRPITDITNALEQWNVSEDAEEVLRTLVPKEKEVAASGERWFKVRMMPYRTSNNRIDGVVITLSEVSASKRLETRLTKAVSDSEQRLKGAKAAGPARKRSTRAKLSAGESVPSVNPVPRR